MVKPPILYFGAKGSTAERIVDLMPPHDGYIEPFAGSLAVLLAKPRARMEVVNDIDREIMTFWRVVREQPDDLQALIDLTPHSRAELELSHDRDGIPDLEVARRVWVRLTQGRAPALGVRTGWRYFSQYVSANGNRSNIADYLNAYRRRMPEAAERIADVSLECRDALEVIADYGQHRANLLYVDPPYLGSTRRGSRYAHELTGEDQHRALAEALHSCSATVMLSGYASDLYDRELFPDWSRVELGAFTGNGATDTRRTEVVWINRDIEGALW